MQQSDTHDFTAEHLPVLSRAEALRLRKQVLKAFGRNAETVLAILDTLEHTGATIKDTRGYIVFKNRHALSRMNLADDSTVLGRRAQDLYPQKFWRIYIGREEPTLRTGKPLINKIYGYVADQTKAHNSVSVYALRDDKGKIIGTLNTFRRVEAKSERENWYRSIEETIDYIAQHYAEPLTNDLLAANAHMSTSHFIRHFQKHAGLTPMKYLTKIRLNAARELLTTTKMLITDIAQACGFYDHAHFIRTFKAHTGQTPAAFRRRD